MSAVVIIAPDGTALAAPEGIGQHPPLPAVPGLSLGGYGTQGAVVGFRANGGVGAVRMVLALPVEGMAVRPSEVIFGAGPGGVIGRETFVTRMVSASR